jgi:glycine cleavage system aminomethyltransferase T
MRMSKAEWIARRQEKAKAAWDAILASGWDAEPCHCGREGCEGWRLVKKEPPPKVLLDAAA